MYSQCNQRQQQTQMEDLDCNGPYDHSQTTRQDSWFHFWHHKQGLIVAISHSKIFYYDEIRLTRIIATQHVRTTMTSGPT